MSADRVPSGTPPTQKRDAIREVLMSHAIECTGRGEVSCRCHNPSGWMCWPDYFDHVADAIAAALRSPDPVRPPEPPSCTYAEIAPPSRPWKHCEHWWKDEAACCYCGDATEASDGNCPARAHLNPAESPILAPVAASEASSGQGEPNSVLDEFHDDVAMADEIVRLRAERERLSDTQNPAGRRMWTVRPVEATGDEEHVHWVAADGNDWTTATELASWADERAEWVMEEWLFLGSEERTLGPGETEAEDEPAEDCPAGGEP